MKPQIVNPSTFLIVLVVLILLIVQGVTYGATTVLMSPSSVVSPSVGQQLTFSINITGGMAVASFRVDVTFDPTALSYVSISSGGYIVRPLADRTDVSNDMVRFGEGTYAHGEDGAAGADGDGTLATVTFRVVEVKDSTVGLSASLANSRWNPIGVTVQGASVTATATENGGTSTTNTGPPPLEKTQTKLIRISGDGQEGLPGKPLANPFVVQVLDEDGDPFEGATVKFSVLLGDGSLSAMTLKTDADGQAESILTLGTALGTNKVQVNVEGISQVLVFSTEATTTPSVPRVLSIISGDNQSGVVGESLTNPFVVEVRDENSNPLENVTVNFAVLTGGGTLNTMTATTDTNGQAESTLILGNDPGTNTVQVSVEGTTETVIFNAEAVLPLPTPTTLSIVPRADDETDPYVVQVHDQDGNPLEDVTVTFTIHGDDGSTSTTTVMTDENGQAAFTLRPRTNPGTYTITGSVEGVAETVTFTAIVSFEFDLSLLSGFSLIHIPLKVKAINGMPMTLQSVADLYDALGGTDSVNWLITHDPQTQTWHGYYGDADRESIANRALTDQTGVLVNINAPISVRLSGDALGIDGTSTLILTPGLNLVGLPLRDSRITRVSDLFTLEGIDDNITAIVVTDNGEFRIVGRVDDPGDIPITGGQSFFLITQSAAMAPISGDGWGDAAPVR